jgi:hypothetical protein
MLLEQCINLTLGLLQTKHVTNDDQWKEGHALIETYVFDRSYMISPTVVASITGLYPRCEGQLHSHE